MMHARGIFFPWGIGQPFWHICWEWEWFAIAFENENEKHSQQGWMRMRIIRNRTRWEWEALATRNRCRIAYIYAPTIAYIFAYIIECTFTYIFTCIYLYTFRSVKWRFSANDSQLHMMKLARLVHSNVYAIANYSQQIWVGKYCRVNIA